MKRIIINFTLISALLLFSLIPVLNIVADDTTNDYNDSIDLPVIGSYQNLKALLKNTENIRGYMYGGVAELATADGAVLKTTAADSNATPDYSATNVQVEGVDEADVIKTDGEYIYQVNNQRIIITKAYPANEMKIIETIDYKDSDFFPREIYVDDKYLVVIGSSITNNPFIDQKPEIQTKKMIAPPYFHSNNVKAIIYDIQDKNSITQLRDVEMEGNYISSRKIGSSLYLVANKFLDIYYIQNNDTELPAPFYRDSVGTGEAKGLDYNSIHYFPDSLEPNYLMIGGLDLDNMEQEINVSAYMGAGQNIYSSVDNLYVTVTQFDMDNIQMFDVNERTYIERNSSIFKFKLDSGKTKLTHQGTVPGNILNQFSMDEHNGYFRIATTTGEIWRNDEHTSKNNIYILDDKLELVGEIEDIAPGERIYSVRFMGGRGYMVTFKTVDPLFVIDLKDPTAPKILGKLKIPGYSDYLHPYDENHLIGFGKDTIELTQKNGSNNQPMAYYQGMKIAIFDVTDVNNPKEKFVEIIGDRGTYSELLQNHKALLFSKDKNLLSFPVTVMEVKDKDKKDELQYGEFAFQGAYVYNLDLETGFTLKKTITHITEEGYNKSGYRWYGSIQNVRRIIYIDDILYTISNGMVKAHQLDSLKDINSIALP